MTKGDETGTSGWARAEWRPWLAVFLACLVLTFVNATSDIMEGAGDHWSEPILWEATSAIIIVALAPLIGHAMQRWPFREGNLPAFLLIHFGLTIPFALVHIGFIFVTRETAYRLFGARYGFFDDGVAITLLYEWRKDVLVYAAIAATYWIFSYIAERNRAASSPPTDDRIRLQDGGAAVFLAPEDISQVEAAGNYVEFHTAEKSHLVRGTLASWEERLTARGFVRVHRSRLVNRSKIAELRPTRSGDFEIALMDGRTVAGSRRYRAGLSESKSA
ncbi:LytTR family DNA-binding domain-containing protein [Parasphingorhabdus sp.]|uniref:LytTR family DNA-binding domain-containing protein n=1 Tax=Parasphingorhabdus sp. TaxID=2709688 RepID=UPI001B4CEF6D|nr:LytTR family DNA-binding domain-containing protein [Parasphingorhabdus sp.]MBQ0770409.1 LytTR family transcriptional regulator [Sphingomonadales bacterium]